jgi:hypothetical protein
VRGYFGVGGAGVLVLATDRELGLSNGGGFSLFGGLDLGRYFAVEFGYAASFHSTRPTNCTVVGCAPNNASLSFISLDIRLRLPTGTRFVPFVQASGFGTVLGRDAVFFDRFNDAFFQGHQYSWGGGAGAGGGFDLWITPWGSLGARAIYRASFVEDEFFPFPDHTIQTLSIEGDFVARF